VAQEVFEEVELLSEVAHEGHRHWSAPEFGVDEVEVRAELLDVLTGGNVDRHGGDSREIDAVAANVVDEPGRCRHENIGSSGDPVLFAPGIRVRS